MLHDAPNSATVYRDALVQVDDAPWTWPDERPTAERECPAPWIVLPRRGLYTKFSRGDEVIADRVSALFYNSGELYRYVHHSRAGACTYLLLAGDFLAELLGRAGERPRFPAKKVWRSARCDLAHHFLLRALQHTSRPDALAVQEAVATLVRDLLAASEDAPGAPQNKAPCGTMTRAEHRDLVADAQRFLGRDLERTPSLAQIAAAVGTSPWHLARIFRRETGASLHAYLRRLRLLASLEPLGDARRDTTEIALALGFSSRSHFSRAFTRAFGLPPSEFRRMTSRARARLARR